MSFTGKKRGFHPELFAFHHFVMFFCFKKKTFETIRVLRVCVGLLMPAVSSKFKDNKYVSQLLITSSV
jgi:hypothetical protein